MRRKFNIGFFFISFIFFSSLLINSAIGGEAKININLDSKVSKFIESHRSQWVAWNIPEVDGAELTGPANRAFRLAIRSDLELRYGHTI